MTATPNGPMTSSGIGRPSVGTTSVATVTSGGSDAEGRDDRRRDGADRSGRSAATIGEPIGPGDQERAAGDRAPAPR